MANTKILQVKRTTVSGRLPNTSVTSNSSYIYPGEFAFNLADRKLYSQYAGAPFEVGANLSSLNVTGDATVTGSLTVVGNTIYTGNVVYINTTNLTVGDNIITLNSDVTGTPTESAGIEVNRGTSSNVSFLWDETNTRWTLGSRNFYVGGSINAASISVTNFTAANIAATNLSTTNNFSISSVTMIANTSDLSSLLVTANSLYLSGALSVGNNVTGAANLTFVGYITSNSGITSNGTLSVAGVTTLANTTVNGAFTVTGTTTNTSIQSTQTTGTITIGGTTGTGAITVGQSTGIQTLGVATGATVSGNNKTVNIGTSGLSGSITNVNIGSAVSGATGTTTINSNNVVVPNNLAVTGTANVATTINVGANLTINTTSYEIGNSTVNSVLTSTSLLIGNTVANTTALAVGANVIANTTALLVGNSSVNSIITSSLLTTTTANLSTSVNVGANVNLSTTQIKVGNSSVNTVITSTTITGNAAATLGNTTINGSLTVTANTVAAQINATSINVGANVSISATQLNIGNSTVNTVITSTTMTGNGAGILNVNAATVGSNTASDLRTYSETQAANAYTTAQANSANATNITSGTLATARLPATVNVATIVNVGANVNLSTSSINVGNATINTVITSSTITTTGNVFASGGLIVNTNSSTDAVRITQIGAGNALLIEDDTSPDSTPTVIDASGVLVRGATAKAGHWYANSTVPESYFVGNSGSTGVGVIGHAVNPIVLLARTANTTLGGRALVSDGDNIGTVVFAGDANNGGGFAIGARIIGNINGTANGTSLPGSLAFAVTPANALIPSTRMTLYANDTISFSTNTNLNLNGFNVLSNTQHTIGNTTSNATLTQTTLNIGTSTSNVQINSSSLTVGNTSSGTVNAYAINLGANVNISTSRFNIGNSTVNTYITASSISTNGTLTVTGNTTAGQINATSINANNLSLSGNLTVSGSITYLNSTTLNIGDNLITLNADLTNVTAPTENAGIEVNRGSAANTSFYWDEINARWTAANNTYVAGTLTTTGNTVAAQINATSINVGANVTLNTTAISVGNSTVNSIITSTSISGNGAGVLNVNAATVGSNTASDLRTYSETQAANAYTTAQANSANATNITSGTLATARLPSTVNVATFINVGSNVNLNTSELRIGNATTNVVLSSIALILGSNTINIGNAAYVVANGNMGVGVYPNAWKLSVNGPAVANVANSQSLVARFSSLTNNSDALEITNTRGTTDTGATPGWQTAGFRLQQKVDATWMGYMQFNGTASGNNDGGISFGTGTSSSNAISITERLRIAPSGNVGISNTAPDATLKVTGTANVSGAVVLGSTLLITGNTTAAQVNATSINIGANVVLSTSSISVGNATINTVITSTSITGNGAGLTTVNAATLGSNTASDLRTYSDTAASNAYTTAVANTSNATNITSGTLDTARLPATVNVATILNVGSNVGLSTSQLTIGNTTVNSYLSATNLKVNTTTISSNALTISGANATANATILLQLDGGQAQVELGGSVGAYIDFKTPYADDFDYRVSSTTTGLGITAKSTTSTANAINIVADTVFVNSAFTVANSSGNTFIMNANGDVGINTTGGGAGVSDLLHIRKDSNTNIGILVQNRSANLSAQSSIKFIMGSFDLADSRYSEISGYTTASGGSGLQFRTGNGTAPVNRITVLSTGNVGISNTAPDATLAVTGNANVSANVVIGGTISIAGNTTANSTTLTTRAISANAITVTVTTATTGLDMNGSDIVDVNKINISDPGPYEGILIDGGSGWAVFESPNDLTTNGSGNLQFVVANTRVVTMASTGIDTPYTVTANLALRVVDTNGTATVNSTVVTVGSIAIGTALQKFVTYTAADTSSNQVADTLSSSTYRSIKYTIQVTGGGFYQASEVSLIHDGTTVYKTEYGINSTTTTFSTCTADISGGNVRLLVTPLYAGSVYKIFRTAIPV